MTKAAQSMYVFGVYGALTGMGFVIAPETMISTLHMAPISPGWARTIGMLAFIIGVDDIVAARAECVPFLKLSVPLRYGFATGITTLVVTGQMSVTTLGFGAVDLVGATWTMLALRSQRASA